MKVYVFTDGASKGNPGPGGWGAVIALPDLIQEIGGREGVTTNNRMELTAALQALVSIDSLASKPDSLVIFSDSSYLINGITKWIFGWSKNSWKNSKKEDVLNADLWRALQSRIQGKKITWKYVPGHSDVAGNERANDIAEEFALNKKIELFFGSSKDYSIKLLDAGEPLDRTGKVSALVKSSSSKSKSKKAFSYVSMVDGKIETHKTWDECKARVSGKSALYKKATTKAEEGEIIAAFRRQI